ncbi:MAG: type II toxin-antitoxin system Phd/YefM family antitoxin [Caldilineaceae bacterium]|nr:type II toxin-antitoxin system Phd/YefM family antitoxin [Caldilineaceae bacterium]
MPKTITASEAESRFEKMVQWVVENQDDVIVRESGEPAIVMVPFAEYEQILAWRERDRHEEAFEQFEAIRRRVQEDMPVTDLAEAYRQAGMAEWVIRETLAADEAIARNQLAP